MSHLSPAQMESLLAPFLEAPVPDPPTGFRTGTAVAELSVPELVAGLNAYLELLVRWNARTNLTAIRSPEEVVVRHFGESLFAGRVMAKRVSAGARVLDFGSGAGFPGAPVKLLLPSLHVTLAESQGKKAAFLRELQRVVGVDEVWGRRVENMPPGRRFDVVMLRAVDRMELALAAAETRVVPGGCMVVLTGEPKGWPVQIPGSEKRFVDVRQV